MGSKKISTAVPRGMEREGETRRGEVYI